MKKLALTAAALAVISAPALAADLPSRKASPVNYVKICDVYGAGFFYIPGTDSCIKFGGRLRVDYDFRSNAANPVADNRRDQASGFYNRAVLQFDHRTQTAWGTLQAVGRMRLQAGSGTQEPGDTSSLELAYVRFAGFTFGQGPQPFSFMSAWSLHSSWWTGWPNGVKQLTYTALLGGGLSATFGITDATQYNGLAGCNTGAASCTRNDQQFKDWGNHAVYVANLRLDQGWGRAQVMGAFGRSDRAAIARETNYAIGAGLEVRLPQLGRGDSIQLTAVYWDGMPQLGIGNANLDSPSNGAYGGIRPLNWNVNVTNSRGYSFGAQMRHYWSPTVRSQLHGAYARLTRVTNAAGVNQGSATVWNVGKGLIWSPARSFDIGLEVFYLRGNYDQVTGVTTRANGWVGRMRVERNF